MSLVKIVSTEDGVVYQIIKLNLYWELINHLLNIEPNRPKMKPCGTPFKIGGWSKMQFANFTY